MEHKSQDWHRADIKSALEKEALRSENCHVLRACLLIRYEMYLPATGPEQNRSSHRRWKPRRT